MKRLTLTDQGGQKIVNLGTPTSSSDAATMGYADGVGSKVRTITATVGPAGSDYPRSSYSSMSVAINAAITAVNAGGGGIVQIRGQWLAADLTGAITMKSNVWLR